MKPDGAAHRRSVVLHDAGNERNARRGPFRLGRADHLATGDRLQGRGTTEDTWVPLRAVRPPAAARC